MAKHGLNSVVGSEHDDNVQVDKSPSAFKTISEVSKELDVPQHVLRFWENKFPQISPLKRRGGRRYYRPEDVRKIKAIKKLLYEEGYTIKGAIKFFTKKPLEAKAMQQGRSAASSANENAAPQATEASAEGASVTQNAAQTAAQTIEHPLTQDNDAERFALETEIKQKLTTALNSLYDVRASLKA